MKRFVTITAVAMAMAMLVPSGSATWRSYGGAEPDNAFDAGWMWEDAPDPVGCVAPSVDPEAENPCGIDLVYFNVFTTVIGPTGWGGPTPNSATLGSRLETGTVTLTGNAFIGYLGLWIDCNQDGYVGLGDGALREYRDVVSENAGFPINEDICPVDQTDGTTPTHYGQGWVTEMIPITNFTFSTDPRLILDRGAKMWGDAGAPKYIPPPPGGGEGCPPIPLARTGAFLRALDCQVDGNIGGTYAILASNDPTGTLASQGNPTEDGSTWDQPLTEGIPELPDVPDLPDTPDVIGDSDQACKDKSENVPCNKTDSGAPGHGSNAFVAGAQDCSQDPIVDLGETTGNHDFDGVGPRTPSPAVNQNGNLQAQTNQTWHEAGLDVGAGDGKVCESRDDYASPFAGQPQQTVNADAKESADLQFGFRPWNNRWGSGTPCSEAGISGRICGQPQDLGLPWIYNMQGVGGNLWQANAGSESDLGGVIVDRDAGSVTPHLFDAGSWTFYVSLVSVTTGLPHNGDGIYGAEWCGNSLDVRNGWDCDPDNWYINANTGEKIQNYQNLGQVRDPYQLRDVDCYDWTVATAESPAGQEISLRNEDVYSTADEGCVLPDP